MRRRYLPNLFSSHFPFFWEEEEWDVGTEPSGVSIYEDEDKVYVEAFLPGIDPEEIEITYDKGILWIKGEKKEEEKEKKFYRKATSSFSYRVALPIEVDEEKEPSATYKNGIMKVSFSRKKEYQPKKISIKKG